MYKLEMDALLNATSYVLPTSDFYIFCYLFSGHLVVVRNILN